MPGDWIKVESVTPDKKEVVRMARKLGIDRDAVVGKLVRFWIWMDQQSEDGVVDGLVDADVDAFVSCDGFAGALIDADWLHADNENERLTLPDFSLHHSESAKKRALKTRRQKMWRQKRDGNADAHVDAPVDDRSSTDASTRERERSTSSLRSEVRRTSDEEPEWFKRLKQTYPKRKNGQRWADARRACNARLREGYTEDDLIAGAERYAAYVRTRGDEGTEFVQQAATFFGKNLGFAEPWEVGSGPPARGGGESASARFHRRQARTASVPHPAGEEQ